MSIFYETTFCEIYYTLSIGEFDNLLVFMFDRIGRSDNETPFVVEWFAKHSIEAWSTQAGRSGSAIKRAAAEKSGASR